MAILVSYQRTPFGRLLGGLSSLSAMDLGTHAITAALRQAQVDPQEVDFVVGGQVLQAGQGQNPTRQSAIRAGISLTAPQVTLNAVCLSGAEAISYGARLIAQGEASIVVCVGQESMSQAPHVMKNSRSGKKYGALEVIDSLEIDGLTDPFTHESMGAGTERVNAELGISRLEQDTLAVASHTRATKHQSFLAGEIAPIETVSWLGSVLVERDEGVRAEISLKTIGALRPAFDTAGTITAANASPISDGAASVVLMSQDLAEKRGIRGLATIESHALTAGPTTALHSQPSQAITQALDSKKLRADSLAALEINEAFASVVIQSAKDLGVSLDIVNRHGGAIAFGHPIGASGTRIVGTLARHLSELGSGSYGAAGICGGGGQGSALILRAV